MSQAPQETIHFSPMEALGEGDIGRIRREFEIHALWVLLDDYVETSLNRTRPFGYGDKAMFSQIENGVRLLGQVGQDSAIEFCLSSTDTRDNSSLNRAGEIMRAFDPDLTRVGELIPQLIQEQEKEEIARGILQGHAREDFLFRLVRIADRILSTPDEVVQLAPGEKAKIYQNAREIMAKYPQDKIEGWLKLVAGVIAQPKVTSEPGFLWDQAVFDAVSLGKADPGDAIAVLAAAPKEDVRAVFRGDLRENGLAFLNETHFDPVKLEEKGLEGMEILLDKLPTGDGQIAQAVLMSALRLQANLMGYSGSSYGEFVRYIPRLLSPAELQYDLVPEDGKIDFLTPDHLIEAVSGLARASEVGEPRAKAYLDSNRKIFKKVLPKTAETTLDSVYQEVRDAQAPDKNQIRMAYMRLFGDFYPSHLTSSSKEDANWPRWAVLTRQSDGDWIRKMILIWVKDNLYNKPEEFVKDLLAIGMDEWVRMVRLHEHPLYIGHKTRLWRDRVQEKMASEGNQLMQRCISGEETDPMNFISLVNSIKPPEEVPTDEFDQWLRGSLLQILSTREADSKLKGQLTKEYWDELFTGTPITLGEVEGILSNLRGPMTDLEGYYCEKAAPEKILEMSDTGGLKSRAVVLTYLLNLSRRDYQQLGDRIFGILTNWLLEVVGKHDFGQIEIPPDGLSAVLNPWELHALAAFKNSNYWSRQVEVYLKKNRDITPKVKGDIRRLIALPIRT